MSTARAVRRVRWAVKLAVLLAILAGHAAAADASTLVFDDEFSGAAGAPPSATRWHVITDGQNDNSELEYYTARAPNVALDGQGHLGLTALSGTYTGTDGITRSYTSGRIETKGLFSTTYGTLEARIQVPAGTGLWPAFWALGSNIDTVSWPDCGEIDLLENLGGDPFTAYQTIHGPSTASPSGYQMQTVVHSAASLAAGYHTYGVSWRPGTVTFSLDGKATGTFSSSMLTAGQTWALDHPFYLVLNLAVGGNWPGSPTAGTQFPARMLVDWVRVWSNSSSTTAITAAADRVAPAGAVGRAARSRAGARVARVTPAHVHRPAHAHRRDRRARRAQA